MSHEPQNSLSPASKSSPLPEPHLALPQLHADILLPEAALASAPSLHPAVEAVRKAVAFLSAGDYPMAYNQAWLALNCFGLSSERDAVSHDAKTLLRDIPFPDSVVAANALALAARPSPMSPINAVTRLRLLQLAAALDPPAVLFRHLGLVPDQIFGVSAPFSPWGESASRSALYGACGGAFERADELRAQLEHSRGKKVLAKCRHYGRSLLAAYGLPRDAAQIGGDSLHQLFKQSYTARTPVSDALGKVGECAAVLRFFTEAEAAFTLLLGVGGSRSYARERLQALRLKREREEHEPAHAKPARQNGVQASLLSTSLPVRPAPAPVRVNRWEDLLAEAEAEQGVFYVPNHGKYGIDACTNRDAVRRGGWLFLAGVQTLRQDGCEAAQELVDFVCRNQQGWWSLDSDADLARLCALAQLLEVVQNGSYGATSARAGHLLQQGGGVVDIRDNLAITAPNGGEVRQDARRLLSRLAEDAL
jgi:hypothetical protein